MSQSELFPEPEKPRSRAGITPRDYQIADHDETFRLWDSGIVGVLTRCFTGGGKTLCACLKADTWLQRGDDYRVMILSYEQELVNQFAREVMDYIGIDPQIEMGIDTLTDPKFVPKVIVATRQSLQLWPEPTDEQKTQLAEYGLDSGCLPKFKVKAILKMLQRHDIAPDLAREEIARLNSEPEAAVGRGWSRVHKYDWHYNWLLVMDEAHKWAMHLRQVAHLVAWFDQNPLSRRQGITATPKRADGISIGDKMFPGIALDYPLMKPGRPCGVLDGWAVPYRQRYIEVSGVDFKTLGKIGNDFDEGQLERELGNEKTLATLVNPLLDMVEDRRTLIFSPTVQMAKDVAAFINARSRAVCTCGKATWHPTLLIGDGAECVCGRAAEAFDVDKSDQARQLDGTTPDRTPIYEGHQRGDYQFLSITGLCVARNSRVLTDCGEVPIQNVTKEMRVWDGIEFVSHDGVVFKGYRPVIEYAGLRATEDHDVWTAEGWKRLAECKEKRLAIAVSGVGGTPVREACHYYRTNDNPRGSASLGSSVHRLSEDHAQVEEVYDILNAGPRHRFTANGLIVSNCREGYNDREISCVAVFRPVSKEASSLAEQMKGRSCRPLKGTVDGGKSKEERLAAIAASEKPFALVVDLVGITGLPDCASTVEIYAEGLPDKIIQRARDIIIENGIDEEADVGEAIEQAKREDADAKAKAKAERERAEQHARDLAERRAKAGAETNYTAHEVGYGSQVDTNGASEAQYHYMGFLGLDIRNTALTKRQAGRIIDQIQKGMKIEDVAYQNGIEEANWSIKGPSFKQINALRNVPHEWVKSGADASALISAVKNVPEFEQRMIEDIHKASNPERLHHIGVTLVNVNKSIRLPGDVYGRIVAAGKAKKAGTHAEPPQDDF